MAENENCFICIVLIFFSFFFISEGTGTGNLHLVMFITGIGIKEITNSFKHFLMLLGAEVFVSFLKILLCFKCFLNG